MKSINSYINEKLFIRKGKTIKHKFFPKNKKELQELIMNRIELEGPEVNLNDIDVSQIEDMSSLFRNIKGRYDKLNCDVSKWNVSKVKHMNNMFFQCKSFNCDLSDWDVSNVRSMGFMFVGCESFEGDGLENWNVGRVESFFATFADCKKFNPDISDWDVGNVGNFDEMFENCYNFNQDLNNWNVHKVASKENMFKDCNSLKNLPKWIK